MDAPGARTPAPRAAAARPRPPSRAESSSSCRRANHHPTHLSSLFSRYRDTLLEQQYQQLQATYNVLAHTTSVSTYASRLGGVANGFGANQIGGAMTGVGSLAGAADQVANLRFFSSSGTDFSATEMTRRAQRLGNIQAAAMQGMQQSEQRIAGLRELMTEIDGQPDIQASAALNNRIQAEHALLSAQQQQLAQLQLMAATQQQGDLLRAEEAQRQSAERYRDSLQPLGDN
ncbi:type IV secretion system protein [Roseomonas cutis]|uniref:type IV secretion system protein n=1 Tax=Roseomonas cutis TaxID=2897332 RepID=UPI00351CFB35